MNVISVAAKAYQQYLSSVSVTESLECKTLSAWPRMESETVYFFPSAKPSHCLHSSSGV